MMKAKWFSWKDISKIKKSCNDYDLIFIGDDFCDRMIPDLKAIKDISTISSQYDTLLGIKTPVISEHNIDEYCKFVDTLSLLEGKIYITVNDWGLLYYLTQKRYSNFKIIIGRFLTRQKVDRFTSQLKGIIPDAVYSHFCTPTLLNEGFTTFAHSLDINCYEVENVPNAIEIPATDLDYEIMVPFPYVCTALTRYCPYYQCDNDYLKIRMCNKECIEEKISLHAKVHGEYRYISNALVFENQKLPSDMNIKILLDEMERG